MATRANVVFRTQGQDPVWIYRHWDGYPASVMPDLRKMIAKNSLSGAAQYAAHLIEIGTREDGRKCYELIGGPNSDIEWLYVVFVTEQGWVDRLDPLPICSEAALDEHLYRLGLFSTAAAA